MQEIISMRAKPFMECGLTDRARLPELPEAMANRARWARETACKDPSSVEMDHELLPWVFCEEDDLWYSFDGNYSTQPPSEKIKKYNEWQAKRDAYNAKREEEADREYKHNLYWSQVRKDILIRDDYTCQLCGKQGCKPLHIHHILKRKEAGTDHYDNLLTTCPKCHKQADTKLYDPEYGKE